MTEKRPGQPAGHGSQGLKRSPGRPWRRSVRIVKCAAALLTGAGLVAGAAALARRGSPRAAKVCLAGGALAAACGILEPVIF